MKSFVTIIAVIFLFSSCKNSMSANVEIELQKINLTLNYKYETRSVEWGYDRGKKKKSFSLDINEADSKAIAQKLRQRSCYQDVYMEVKNVMESIHADTEKNKEMCYKANNGYVYQLSEGMDENYKLYLDTVNNTLKYKYYSVVF